MEGEASFSLTQRGHRKLCFKGFQYRKDVKRLNRTYWKCEDKACGARVTETEDGCFLQTKDHNHAPDAVRNQVVTALSTIRELIEKDSEANTTDIIESAISELSPAVREQMPARSSIRKMIGRAKKKNQPPTPNTMEEVLVDDNMMETASKEKWMLCDKRSDGKPLIVLCAPSALWHMSSAETWYGDGAFSSPPQPFGGFYTIHAQIFGSVLPMAYCLLPDNTQQTFEEVIKSIAKAMEDRGCPIALRYWQSDFEPGMMAAVSELFPDVEIRGTFFHFAQCTWKQIIASQLEELYARDIDFSMNCRQLTALSFLPPNLIPRGFQLISSRASPQCSPLIDFFRITFIGSQVSADVEFGAEFPPHRWSVFSTVAEDAMIHTHQLEIWHRSFSNALERHKDNLSNVVQYLKEEQDKTKNQLEMLFAGETLNVTNKKQKMMERKFKTYQESLNQQNCTDADIIKFITLCAHLVSYIL